MIETIYKTPTPEKGKSECYVLVLTSRAASGGRVFAFMEEHGQWHDDMQRFLYMVNSVSVDEQLTYQHALDLYDTAKHKLARKGFIHSFAPSDLRNEPSSVQVPEPELAIA